MLCSIILSKTQPDETKPVSIETLKSKKRAYGIPNRIPAIELIVIAAQIDFVSRYIIVSSPNRRIPSSKKADFSGITSAYSDSFG